MSIKTKLISAIAIVTIIGSVTVGSFTYRQIYQHLINHAYDDAKNTLNNMSLLVTFYLNRAEDNLTNLANDTVIIEALETKDPSKLAQASEKLTVIAETISIIEGIGLHEISGSICINRTADKASLSVVGRNFSDRDYCKGIIKTKAPYLSSVFVSAATKYLVLGIAIPVKNAKGEMLGYVIGTLNPNELFGYLSDIQDDSSVILLDRYGTPFLNTKEKIEKLNNPPTALVREIQKQLSDNKKEGYFRYGNDFIGYRNSASLTVVFKTSEANLFALTETLKFTIVFVSIIAIVIFTIIISLLVRAITERISRLSQITQEIAKGKLQIKLEKNELKAKDEVGILTRAFNDMVVKLNASQVDLEKKVLDRTRDLENAKVAARNVLEDFQTEKEELARVNAKDEALLSSIGEGVIATDQDGKIILINQAAERMLGWSAEQMIGKLPVEAWKMVDGKGNIIPETKRPIVLALGGKTTTTSTDSPYFYIRKDETNFPVAIAVAPVKVGNKIIGAIDVFRDITHEKEIDRAKTEFVSLASHELRTPLTAIDGLVSMILGGEYGPVDNNLKQPLEDVNTSSERLIHLVNNLLNLSRIQAGKLKYTLSNFSISDKILHIVSLLQPVAQEKRLMLKTAKLDNIIVKGDQDKVEEILDNLIGNAIKFTDKGNIGVSTKVVGDKVEVYIADTGIGIAKEDQAKLFERFEQLGSSLGRPAGTGLGLHISRELVRKMGGNLWLEKSMSGAGSTFAFSLPLAKSQLAIKVKEEIEKEVKENPDQKGG